MGGTALEEEEADADAVDADAPLVVVDCALESNECTDARNASTPDADLRGLVIVVAVVVVVAALVAVAVDGRCTIAAPIAGCASGVGTTLDTTDEADCDRW